MTRLKMRTSSAVNVDGHQGQGLLGDGTSILFSIYVHMLPTLSYQVNTVLLTGHVMTLELLQNAALLKITAFD